MSCADPMMWFLRMILLSLHWKRFLCQTPGYNISVAKKVTVQKGLCVLIQCSFTHPSTTTISDNPYGYWYKGDPNDPGKLMVAAFSNANSSMVSVETNGRFQFVGDIRKRDCSMTMNDIKSRDKGTYHFRFEDFSTSSYRYNYLIYPSLTVTALSDKPVMSPARVLTEGEEVVLNCTAPGKCSGTPPKIKWTPTLISTDVQQMYSVNNTDGTQTHFSVITFNASRKDHNTRLTCAVDYQVAEATTSEAIQLNIEYPPGINISIQDGTTQIDTAHSVAIQEGVNLILVCTADSNPLANLTWMKGEEFVNVSNTHIIENKLELPIQRITPSDGGTYWCVAVNKHGRKNDSLTVTVEYPPRTPKISILDSKTKDFSSERQSNTPEGILEGTTLRMHCYVDSTPLANLTWTKQGDDIIKELDIAHANSLTLSLSNVTPEADGEYLCVAANKHGMANASLIISVEYKPKLSARYNSSCQRNGNQMICVCVIKANPLPKIQWKINETTLPESDFHNETLHQSFSTDGHTKNSTLTVNASKVTTLGIFCLYSNKHGNAVLTLQNGSDVVAPEPALMPMIVGVVAGAFLMAALCMMGWLYVRSVRRTRNANKGSNDKTEMVDDITLIYSEVHKSPKGPMGAADHRADSKLPSSAKIAEPNDDLYENSGEDNLQYASIDFSKLKPKSNSTPLEEETVYSEIKLQ